MSKLIVKNRYGTIPNDILNHKELSLKAKGLFGYLQSKPDNWNFSTQRIAGQLKESEKTIRSTLQELERFGLLIREPKPKDDKGRWTGYYYTLKDSITIGKKPSLPKRVGRINGSMGLGEDISNKDNSKQDIVNNIIDTAKQSFAETEHLKIQEILNTFYEINPTLNFANKTQRKAVEELIQKFGFEKTLNTVKFSNSIQGNKYAPTITTPLELKNNLAKLMVYYKREQEPKKGTVPNFKF